MNREASDGTVDDKVLCDVTRRVRSPRSVECRLRALTRSEPGLAVLLKGGVLAFTRIVRKDGAPPEVIASLDSQLRLLGVRMLAALKLGDSRSRRKTISAAGTPGRPPRRPPR